MPDSPERRSLQAAKYRSAGFRSHVAKLLQMDPGKVTDVPARLQSLSKYSETMTALDTEIQLQLETEDEVIDDVSTSCGYQEQIEEYKSRLSAAVKIIEDTDARSVASSATAGAKSIKLPKLELQKFDGNPLEWMAYWEQFQAAVDDNEDLSTVNKFHYLKSSLKDGPQAVIKGLSVTAENFVVAVDLLRERYGQEHVIVNAHIEALIDVPPARDNARLRPTYDNIERHLRGLEALGKEIDSLMVAPLILKKLPNDVRVEVARRNGSGMWDLHKLREAIREEVLARERARSVSEVAKHSGSAPKESITQHSFVTTTTESRLCQFCEDSHGPMECQLSGSDKIKALTEKRMCFICLRRGHSAKYCKSKYRCRETRMHHHRSLCSVYHEKEAHEVKGSTDNRHQHGVTDSYKSGNGYQVKVIQGAHGTKPKPGAVQTTSATTSSASLLSFAIKFVLLKTAVTVVANGKEQALGRLILDDTSQCTYVTSAFVSKLKANPHQKVGLSIGHATAKKGVTGEHDVVNLWVVCRDGVQQKIEAVVVDNVAPVMYREQIDTACCPEVLSLDLADPECLSGGEFEVDILIGADSCYQFIHGDIVRSKSGLVGISTSLGWVLCGPANIAKPTMKQVRQGTTLFTSCTNAELDERLAKLWQIEQIETAEQGGADVLETFKNNVTLEDGRYSVRFTFIPDKAARLPSNRGLALARFRALQRKLRRDEQLACEYARYMQDQERRGIIERVPVEEKHDGVLHYLPHHSVIKAGSKTTKVRVVYDASAKVSPQAFSLNDVVDEGPNLMGNILKILLRFRAYKVAVVSDIEKAFLMVGLNAADRDSTRFFWCESIYSYKLVVFRFARIPFGVKCCPFLLNATVQHHLENSDDPVATTLKNSFYVDNCITSLESSEEAAEFYRKAKQLLKIAGMNLREWASNEAEFVKSLPEEDQESSSTQKVLGLKWEIETDTINLNLPYNLTVQPLTKRTVLHVVSSVFDPLGFVVPVTATARVFLQKLWCQRLEWDQPLGSEFQGEWSALERELTQVRGVSVPRWLGLKKSERIDIHIFADASPTVYAAVGYVKKCDDDTEGMKFVMAKARVSPLKKALTLPRLELMAVLLASDLRKVIAEAFGIAIRHEFVWTDSMIALAWIARGEENKDVFVRNRVRKINERLHEKTNRKYVKTKVNPADVATRPCTVARLLSDPLWYNGPELSALDWTVQSSVNPPVEPEQASLVATVKADSGSRAVGINAADYSSLQKLLRVTAWCLRVFSKDKPEHLSLTADELKKARLLWDKAVQQEAFGKEMAGLLQGIQKGLSKELSLYVDEDGLLRCNGRIALADCIEDGKFPKLLPRGNPYTTLIIREVHEQVMHQGLMYTVSALRLQYWVPKAKRYVKEIIRKCVVCRRWQGRPFSGPEAPPLPKFRVAMELPFAYVGVDFAGPIPCKDAKVWFCLFTCATSRAIHLELVEGLSAVKFLLALRRFIARRGSPLRLISDNAATFKLAQNVLEQAWVEVTEEPGVQNYVAKQGIKWQYNLPRAPWWGGFFERLIGMVKMCMKKSIGTRSLTKDELATQLIEVEAILNSRPLTFVTDEVGERPLTPAQLCGQFRQAGFPVLFRQEDPDYVRDETRAVVIRKMTATQDMLNGFWKRWKREYLLSLREHHKNGNRTCVNPKVGDVVLLVDDLPRGQWRIGLVVQLISGKDSRIRGARVRIGNSVLDRPVQMLVPLEVHAEDVTPEPLESKKENKIEDVRSRPSRRAGREARVKINAALAGEDVEDTA